MICINLLPWRESKLKKMKKILLCQLLVIIISPCMAVGAYLVVETAKLTSKSKLIKDYRMVNQQVLTKVESLNSDLYFSREQKRRRQHLIHIIKQKNQLPDILEMLTREKRTGQVNQLLLDHQSLKINYSTADVDDKLSLFQLLNSNPSFCHISFDPVGTTTIQKNAIDDIAIHKDIINYEFNAKLCDISAN